MFLIGGSITVIIGYIYIYSIWKYWFFPVLVGSIFFSFYLIPALLLHFEYSKIGRKTVITFYPEKKLYIYNNSKVNYEFINENINKVTIYKDKIGWFSTSSFYYTKFELIVNRRFIITPYLTEKMIVDNKIKDKTVKKNRLVPSPFFEKLINPSS